jgi:cytochrome c
MRAGKQTSVRTAFAGRAVAFTLGALSLATAFPPSNRHVVSANVDGQGSDGAPIVTITSPRMNSSYSWNALVNYNIVVSYRGKSTEYQELPPKDVLLRTTYVPDLSTMVVEPPAVSGGSPAGLLEITHSTCLGCHSFKARAMGPSFAAVGRRYPQNQTTIDILSQRIRKGSTGMWGQERMPAHTELTEDQLHAIVVWILQDAANPNVNYYVGTEGTFRMEADATSPSKGGIRLTASYTGPAPTGHPEQAPHGEDTMIVGGR